MTSYVHASALVRVMGQVGCENMHTLTARVLEVWDKSHLNVYIISIHVCDLYI